MTRGLKFRSADTKLSWSQDLNALAGTGTLKESIDARLQLTGGTMTGTLVLAANAASAMEAVPLQQLQSEISTAVSNLVNSSPTTLDTLNELAAALSNDPNFATTITNALAAKAPLASPTFTGDVLVPSNTTNTAATLTLGNVQSLISSIPTATYAAVAGQLVKNAITGGFEFGLATTAVTAGTYSGITVDAYGRVTGATALVEADLPDVTVTVGDVFTSTSTDIGAGLDALQTAIANLGSGNSAQDLHTGDGTTGSFAFTNIVGPNAVANPLNLIVFIDGIRQPISAYTIASTGVTFGTAPVASSEIELLFVVGGAGSNMGAGGSSTTGYAVNFGDGSATSFTITHGLGSEDVHVSVRKSGGSKEGVFTYWNVSSANSITVDTSPSVPTSGEYRVIISKAV